MRNKYENPLCNRYASARMQEIFSPDMKFSTWRKLWVALAESEKELGLDITDNQIAQMKEHIYDINYDVAAEREKAVRHDVLAHIYAYGGQCPDARPIIHSGATSCYVGDNTDLIVMRRGAEMQIRRFFRVIMELCDRRQVQKSCRRSQIRIFGGAADYAGQKGTLWLQDLVSDVNLLAYGRTDQVSGLQGSDRNRREFPGAL